MNRLTAAVDQYRDLIINAQNFIWAHPETGYREWETSKYMEEAFRKLGYELTVPGDIPGFYTVLDTGRPGPEVLIFGELDALLCGEHPDAVNERVHCCGHSAQCAALLGIAAALKVPGALEGLSGRIRLCAVPAEELIEREYRDGLMKEGKIRYYGGKTEFMYRGYFDGVDLAFMVHTTDGEEFAARRGAVGIIAKRIVFKGVSAHAGGAPWQGCNALYAANQGLSAANAIRETFKESDYIRFHPIITKGGGAVNAIPDQVVVESYVRGATYPAIVEANRKVNRALIGGALSLGCDVDIQDAPGYAPLTNAQGMIDLAKDAAEALGFPFNFKEKIGTGSTDMGDISAVMPAIHPYAPGAIGASHGTDYYIANPDLACVGSAKWQLAMLTLLLKDDAARAKEIIAGFTPAFPSKKAYFEYIDSLAASGDRIAYEEGTATVKL
ncbi:MAG: amidohydrolase [Clostridia bacterium]|nr:amidohydrolase [Clostridia bacterium]